MGDLYRHETKARIIESEIGLEDSGGTIIDPATDTTLAVVADAAASRANEHLLVQEETALDVSGATVPTEQQTPVAVEDTSGTRVDPFAAADASQVSASTAAAGSANAASIDLGDVREAVDVFYDVANNNGSIEVEVSTDDATWRPLTSVPSGDIDSGGEQAFVQVETAYQFVRAYAGGSFADGDVNTIETVSRGV